MYFLTQSPQPSWRERHPRPPTPRVLLLALFQPWDPKQVTRLSLRMCKMGGLSLQGCEQNGSPGAATGLGDTSQAALSQPHPGDG